MELRSFSTTFALKRKHVKKELGQYKRNKIGEVTP